MNRPEESEQDSTKTPAEDTSDLDKTEMGKTVKSKKGTVEEKTSEETSEIVPVAEVAELRSDAPEQRDHRRTKWLQVLFVGLLVAVIGFGAGWLGSQTNSAEKVEVGQTKQRVVLNNQGDLISAIAEEVGQSVVSIDVTSQSNVDRYFGGITEQQSAGTGIILTTDGLIVTNRHVVPVGTTDVGIVLADGKKFSAEVVGRTGDTDSLDIAFLQIKNLGDTKLVAAKLGNSSAMKVGHSVVAIGNALGEFQNTVTMGIISGYGRNLVAGDGVSLQGEKLEGLFQTDAAINPGNSGGPLVNIDGEVIGINTAVAGNGAENIGFAIPIDNVKGLIASVEKSGKLERPYLGVVYVMVTDEIATKYNLKVKNGAFIVPSADYGQATIISGAPADEAGLKEGDVIVKVDDTEITDMAGLATVLGRYQPGDKVKLTVNRDGKTEFIGVTLGTLPSTTAQ